MYIINVILNNLFFSNIKEIVTLRKNRKNNLTTILKYLSSPFFKVFLKKGFALIKSKGEAEFSLSDGGWITKTWLLTFFSPF